MAGGHHCSEAYRDDNDAGASRKAQRMPCSGSFGTKIEVLRYAPPVKELDHRLSPERVAERQIIFSRGCFE